MGTPRSPRIPRLSVALAIAVTGCAGDGDGRGDGEAGGIGSSLTGASSNAGSGGSEGEEQDASGTAASLDSGSGSADGTPFFDIGSADDGISTMPEAGCQRVDFLFVIDNSVSMDDQQAALVGAFPGFIEAIQTTLEADSDYHILVTDTDAWGRCTTQNGFVGIDPGSDTCNNYIKSTNFEECDGVRGAGVVHPAGQFASNMPCNLAGGNRYILPSEPDIDAAFACVAQVGVAGHSSERPMESMIAALAPELNAAGECNDGFLRDDALLVIAFVSDDPHFEDTGTPTEWYDAVVDAKLGDPSSVVVLGLIPGAMGCGNGTPNGSHWLEFIELWGDRGVSGDVCGAAEDYVTFFQSTVGVIDQACDDYQPPG
ncbi:MAG: hypothetical protein IAG13_02530 [Deltaproteobacteria bacterium]|nr:hypothetical protein [Nannocystaceae bacterium]